MPAALVRRTAHAGVLAALAYAALKAVWGLGSRVGVTDDAAFDGFVSGFGALEWLATWGTVALAGVAALLLLALVEPWGRSLPRRPLRLAAWLGVAALVVPGFLGLGESLLGYVGLVGTSDAGLAPWVFTVVYGSFSVLAVALGTAALGDRRTAAPAGR